jgi:hypothetical protein
MHARLYTHTRSALCYMIHDVTYMEELILAVSHPLQVVLCFMLQNSSQVYAFLSHVSVTLRLL